MKVKIFSSYNNAENLECAINNFIMNKNINIISIDFSTSAIYDNTKYSAMVVYKETI